MAEEAGNRCNAALVPQLSQTEVKSDKFLAVLNILDKESWDELKIKGGATLDLIVAEVPIGIGASYDQFKTARDQYLSVAASRQTESDSLMVLKKGVTSEQLRYWQQCMHDQLTQGVSPFAHKQNLRSPRRNN